MIVTLIAAMDKNRGIGKDNLLPWRLSSDLKRFKRLTMGHHIVMGRKTFESIGKPLPGRTTIILTRRAYAAEGCLIAHSLAEALEIARGAGEEELFVCGGGAVYAEALPIADRLYMTQVDALVDADTFFPQFEHKEWIEMFMETTEAGEMDQYTATFRQLERRR